MAACPINRTRLDAGRNVRLWANKGLTQCKNGGKTFTPSTLENLHQDLPGQLRLSHSSGNPEHPRVSMQPFLAIGYPEKVSLI
jgi:hypothetical protein